MTFWQAFCWWNVGAAALIGFVVGIYTALVLVIVGDKGAKHDARRKRTTSRGTK